MFAQGYQYRLLNACRLACRVALLSVQDKVEGYDVGQHHQRPRYTQTWDISVVTTCIKAGGKNKSLPLQDLAH